MSDDDPDAAARPLETFDPRKDARAAALALQGLESRPEWWKERIGQRDWQDSVDHWRRVLAGIEASDARGFSAETERTVVVSRRWESKDSLPPGPWIEEVDELVWVHNPTGISCQVARHDWGHLCGYVVVPEGHMLHGDEPRCQRMLSAHRGMVLAAFAEFEGMAERQWQVGFDCAHAEDLVPHLVGEGFTFPPQWTYRGLDYVMGECEFLARQIVGYEQLMKRTGGGE